MKAYCFHDISEGMLKYDHGEIEAILRELHKRYEQVVVIQFCTELIHQYTFENRIEVPRGGWRPHQANYKIVLDYLGHRQYAFACIFTDKKGEDVLILEAPEVPIVTHVPSLMPPEPPKKIKPDHEF